jgi:hypothetical protein
MHLVSSIQKTTSKFIAEAKRSDTWENLSQEDQKQFSAEYLYKMNYSQDAKDELEELMGYQKV